MPNYTDMHGAEVSKWPKNGDQEDWDDRDALVEEFYFEESRGRLNLSIVTDEGLLSIQIPVQATGEWNEFVESLPKWDAVGSSKE